MCRFGGRVTEAELLVEFGSIVDRIWNILQWWASITFAVLLASHVGASSLNKPIVAIMLLLYTLFSLYAGEIVLTNTEMQNAIRAALELQRDSLSTLGQSVLIYDETALKIIGSATILTTYISTILYVLYCYRNRMNTNMGS
jgi:hypothetical protein